MAKLEDITPLELAFVVQDPCGNEALAVAREALRLISNRPDNAECIAIASELRALCLKYSKLGKVKP